MSVLVDMPIIGSPIKELFEKATKEEHIEANQASKSEEVDNSAKKDVAPITKKRFLKRGFTRPKHFYSFKKPVSSFYSKKNKIAEKKPLIINDQKHLNPENKPKSPFNLLLEQCRNEEKNSELGYKDLKKIAIQKWQALDKSEKKALKEKYSNELKEFRLKFNKKQDEDSGIKHSLHYLSAFRIFRKEKASQGNDEVIKKSSKDKQKYYKENWKALKPEERKIYFLKSQIEKNHSIHELKVKRLQEEIDKLINPQNK